MVIPFWLWLHEYRLTSCNVLCSVCIQIKNVTDFYIWIDFLREEVNEAVDVNGIARLLRENNDAQIAFASINRPIPRVVFSYLIYPCIDGTYFSTWHYCALRIAPY